MSKYLRSLGLVSIPLAALSCVPVFAQMTVTGTVTGTVTDPSGQVVPGAKVTMTSTTTRESRTTTSNEIGAFRAKLGPFVHGAGGKAIRILISAGVGIIPPIGFVAGAVLKHY